MSMQHTARLIGHGSKDVQRIHMEAGKAAHCVQLQVLDLLMQELSLLMIVL